MRFKVAVNIGADFNKALGTKEYPRERIRKITILRQRNKAPFVLSLCRTTEYHSAPRPIYEYAYNLGKLDSFGGFAAEFSHKLMVTELKKKKKVNGTPLPPPCKPRKESHERRQTAS